MYLKADIFVFINGDKLALKKDSYKIRNKQIGKKSKHINKDKIDQEGIERNVLKNYTSNREYRGKIK